MSWVSAVGSVFSSAGNYLSAERAWKHQKEYAQNAHQWEVADLKKAGLNPILSTGGSGAPMASAPSTHFENPLAEWSATKLAKKQAEADVQQKKSSSNATEAQAENIKLQTGLERAVYSYKVKEAEWNAKRAEQEYLNSKEMPAVYRSNIAYQNSAAQKNVVDSRRGQAEMPFWETAGEAINSAVSYGKKKFEEFSNWLDSDKRSFDNSHSRRSGFIKHLDDGGTVASYKR